MTDPDPLDRRETGNAAAEVSIRIGARTALDAKVTAIGLLSAGALVSAILLSSAIIVLAAGRHDKRRAIRSVGDGS